MEISSTFFISTHNVRDLVLPAPQLGFIFLDKMSIQPICLTSHSRIQVTREFSWKLLYHSLCIYHSHRHQVSTVASPSIGYMRSPTHIMPRPLITLPCPQLRAKMNARKQKKRKSQSISRGLSSNYLLPCHASTQEPCRNATPKSRNRKRKTPGNAKQVTTSTADKRM